MKFFSLIRCVGIIWWIEILSYVCSREYKYMSRVVELCRGFSYRLKTYIFLLLIIVTLNYIYFFKFLIEV